MRHGPAPGHRPRLDAGGPGGHGAPARRPARGHPWRDPLPRHREPAAHAGGPAGLLGRRGRPRTFRRGRRGAAVNRPSIRDFTAEEDLLGFFGPDSVSWRIHADPAFSVGGIRALLLQALHPVAMDGVARFSTAFSTEPWARLTRTAEYVATLTFGTRREALRSVRRVRGMHRGNTPVGETTGHIVRANV